MKTQKWECSECGAILKNLETLKMRDKEGLYRVCISCLGICHRIS